MEKANIAVLVSGGGTNLQALIDSQVSGVLTSGQIRLVVSNREGAYALTRAAAAGIETLTITRRGCGSQEAFEDALIRALEERHIDLIILAGFLSILSSRFTGRYPRRIINVHPSLIPAFCGKGYYGLRVHEEALRYGVKVTGATVHFVNEVPDGGEIIAQKAVNILPGDTPEILQQRVMEQAEWILLPRAAEQVSHRIAREKAENGKEKAMNIYEIGNLAQKLHDNTYPGRGIVLGMTPDGRSAVAAYFIMGRSVNSRNRVFLPEADGIRTEAHDPSLLKDPSLIIYHPVRQFGDKLIVTNGDQTDTIRDYLAKGSDFTSALNTREFEPDGPNWTPRISGMLDLRDGSYLLNILKSADPDGSACARYTFSYPALPGLGHFLHPYVCDGNPIPTFQGEPERVALCNDIDELTRQIWENLNADNKISLFVRYTELATGICRQRIINKHKED